MQKKKERFQPLQIYQLLPRTNCKLCGCASCYAFAFSLINRTKKPVDCPELLTDAFGKVLKRLNEEFGGGEIIEGTDFVLDEEECTGCGDCVIVCGKALTTVSRPGMLFYRDEVPPVLQIVDGRVQVINWDSCKRMMSGANLCTLCVEKCPFGAIDLVTSSRSTEEEEE